MKLDITTTKTRAPLPGAEGGILESFSSITSGSIQSSVTSTLTELEPSAGKVQERAIIEVAQNTSIDDFIFILSNRIVGIEDFINPDTYEDTGIHSKLLDVAADEETSNPLSKIKLAMAYAAPALRYVQKLQAEIMYTDNMVAMKDLQFQFEDFMQVSEETMMSVLYQMYHIFQRNREALLALATYISPDLTKGDLQWIIDSVVEILNRIEPHIEQAEADCKTALAKATEVKEAAQVNSETLLLEYTQIINEKKIDAQDYERVEKELREIQKNHTIVLAQLDVINKQRVNCTKDLDEHGLKMKELVKDHADVLKQQAQEVCSTTYNVRRNYYYNSWCSWWWGCSRSTGTTSTTCSYVVKQDTIDTINEKFGKQTKAYEDIWVKFKDQATKLIDQKIALQELELSQVVLMHNKHSMLEQADADKKKVLAKYKVWEYIMDNMDVLKNAYSEAETYFRKWRLDIKDTRAKVKTSTDQALMSQGRIAGLRREFILTTFKRLSANMAETAMGCTQHGMRAYNAVSTIASYRQYYLTQLLRMSKEEINNVMEINAATLAAPKVMEVKRLHVLKNKLEETLKDTEDFPRSTSSIS